MEAKNIILVGLGFAVVGGGAYFYFKNKSTTNEGLANTSTSGTSTGGTNTGGTNTGGTNTGGTNTGGTNTNYNPDVVLDSAPVYTNVLSNNPTALELEAKAKAIAKGKELASKICQQKKIRDSITNMDNTVFCQTYGCSGVSAYDTREINALKGSRIASAKKLIDSLNKELGLLGFMEVNCDILRINI